MGLSMHSRTRSSYLQKSILLHHTNNAHQWNWKLFPVGGLGGWLSPMGRPWPSCCPPPPQWHHPLTILLSVNKFNPKSISASVPYYKFGNFYGPCKTLLVDLLQHPKVLLPQHYCDEVKGYSQASTQEEANGASHPEIFFASSRNFSLAIDLKHLYTIFPPAKV